MANRDINLFNAGGDRAKTSKRSPMTYMVLFALVVIVAAIGVLVYFNMKANTAESNYNKKIKIRDNYKATITYVDESGLAGEYKQVKSDIDAAEKINTFVEQDLNLYPHLTPTELADVKSLISKQGNFSFNDFDPDMPESFTPWDYEAIRATFYDNDVSEELANDRNLFYYALQKLAADQEEHSDQNIWYTYYRCYLVVVFIGGGQSLDLENICKGLIADTTINDDPTSPHEYTTPFSVFDMSAYEGDMSEYVPGKYARRPYEGEYYNIMLIPVKSVIERLFDELKRYSASLYDTGELDDVSYYSFDVSGLEFTNKELKFSLTLIGRQNDVEDEKVYHGYMDTLAHSPFFDVTNDVSISNVKREDGGNKLIYQVTLRYKGVEYKEEEY